MKNGELFVLIVSRRDVLERPPIEVKPVALKEYTPLETADPRAGGALLP